MFLIVFSVFSLFVFVFFLSWVVVRVKYDIYDRVLYTV